MWGILCVAITSGGDEGIGEEYESRRYGENYYKYFQGYDSDGQKAK